MKYDFETILNRKNTGSEKWNSLFEILPNAGEDVIPFSIADMEFANPPEIKEELKKYIDEAVFGYTAATDAYYDSVISWMERKHGFSPKKEWFVMSAGVVPVIKEMVGLFTKPEDSVLLLTPVYYPFKMCIESSGRKAINSELILKDGEYSIDFEDFEKKIIENDVKLFILCNPHNPTGIVWSKEQLAKIGEICERNHVVVLADEIHCDLTLPGTEYTPFATASPVCEQISVTCIAPTKTFNIAGLQSAAVCIPNEVLRHKVWRALNTDEVAEGNVFAADVAIAAFNHGESWLNELREYLAQNRFYAEKYIEENIPSIHAVKGQATYLLWLDCKKIGMSSDKLAEMIREKTGLYLSEGCEYRGDGRDFLRMNLACPRSRLEDGLNRLKCAVDELSSCI